MRDRILILGNGFDLDHNLPTSYIDFLNFCNSILKEDITLIKKKGQENYYHLVMNDDKVK